VVKLFAVKNDSNYQWYIVVKLFAVKNDSNYQWYIVVKLFVVKMIQTTNGR